MKGEELCSVSRHECVKETGSGEVVLRTGAHRGTSNSVPSGTLTQRVTWDRPGVRVRRTKSLDSQKAGTVGTVGSVFTRNIYQNSGMY